MMIQLQSFGFKRRTLQGKVFDARVVKNPYHKSALKHKDGRDHDVQKFVMKYPLGSTLVDVIALWAIANPTQPISVGCSWGHHRSVAVVELVAARLRKYDYDVQVTHLDLR